MTFPMPPQLTSVRPARGLAVLLGLIWIVAPGCGVEPDEIDFAGEETGALSGIGATTGQDDGSATDAPGGDGDGDPGSSGDGDPGSTGDGDGDPGGDGDGEGDGPCGGLEITEASDGANAVQILEGPSALEAECGAPGPEQIFVYTASAAGLVSFELSEFEADAAVYVLDETCDPGLALVCELSPDVAQVMLAADESIYVVVDSLAGAITGTLTITIN